ncbi:hypothetical protein [Alkalibacillus almallahensis]|uniref:hypothetical protein n=1 Tax=Alkalibacillus almallahensis TaxID=1379154 RepID=UPI001421C55B|nr:hypothetical protein [Alkalibacillus almallahensis]NIK11201.1 hypothetical protein [Alkalibacillus almallahensis]
MINNMEIKVNNIQFVSSGEEEKVHIHFRGKDPENELNLSGYVPVTVTEYENNSSIDDMQQLVKDKVLERLA